jgi:hypothetical protein
MMDYVSKQILPINKEKRRLKEGTLLLDDHGNDHRPLIISITSWMMKCFRRVDPLACE